MSVITTASLSLREQYNKRMGETVIDGIFNTIDVVKRWVMVITIVAMAVSYFHQFGFFWALGAGLFAFLLPLSLDAPMLALMKVSQLRGIPEANRVKARRMMIVPALASMAINFIAPGHIVLRYFFVWVVIAIVIGEFALSLIKADFSEIEKAESEVLVSTTAPASTKHTPERRAEIAAKMAATKAKRAAERALKEQEVMLATMSPAQRGAWKRQQSKIDTELQEMVTAG